MTLSLLVFGILGFVWIERAFPGSVPHLDYGFSKSPWLALFLIVIVAPFSEEILMRGVFLRGFAARYGTLGGILLSSLFFALAHVSLARMPHTFLLGAMLGWLYVRTGSLWVNIGAHLLNNLMGGIALLLAASRSGAKPDFVVPPFHWSELTLAGMCCGIFLVSMSAVPRAIAAAEDPIPETVPPPALPVEPGPSEHLP
jgi:membrane protease YdiL (CAAX protease family)